MRNVSYLTSELLPMAFKTVITVIGRLYTQSPGELWISSSWVAVVSVERIPSSLFGLLFFSAVFIL